MIFLISNLSNFMETHGMPQNFKKAQLNFMESHGTFFGKIRSSMVFHEIPWKSGVWKRFHEMLWFAENVPRQRLNRNYSGDSHWIENMSSAFTKPFPYQTVLNIMIGFTIWLSKLPRWKYECGIDYHLIIICDEKFPYAPCMRHVYT